MNKARLFFMLASLAFLGMICCLVFVFLPVSEPVEGMLMRKKAGSVWAFPESVAWENEVRKEKIRFEEQYGLDIDLIEIEKQMTIREEYEACYGTSYPLEDVFLTDLGGAEEEGDSGEDEKYWATAEKIQAYVDAYQIDESEYVGMSAEEELLALKEKYGSLEGNNREDILQNVY